MKFEKIDICDVNDSFVRLIRDDWALLTAGEKGNYNTMTVSWGMLGELWGKDVVTVFVRPQRYTYEFMEKDRDGSSINNTFRADINLLLSSGLSGRTEDLRAGC